MASIAVLDWDKKEVGTIELPSDVFEASFRKDVLHTVVKWQLACRRSGTHSTKTKGLVRGGGKKPFKQKGTGNARQGSSRSPLMPGGGTAFGPTPRDYSYQLPKRVRQLGLKVALSHLLSEKKLLVISDMSSQEGKTKELAQRLKTFGLEKALLVDASENQTFKRAARNLKSFRYLSTDGLNVYDLLRFEAAVVTKASVDKIVGRCRGKEAKNV